MDPSTLVPSPDSLIVPWGWFYALLMLTFVLHILFMNVLIGGGIIAFFTSRKSSGSDPTVKTISVQLPILMAFTVNVGIAPLLFVQVLYGNFIYVSSQLMAVWWLSIIGIAIVAYYLLYIYKFKFEALAGRVGVLGAAIVLLLVVGFFLVNNMTLMISPESWTAYFQNSRGTILNFGDPQLFPRYLHFLAAALAVGGLYMAVVWKIREKRGVVGAAERIKTGMRWFFYATVAQLFLGPLFLITLKQEVMLKFLGGDALFTGMFLAAMLLVVLALLTAKAGRVYLTAAVTFVLVLAMAFVRDLVRTAYLGPYHNLSDLPVSYQYSSMVMFLVIFVVGLALVYYMLRLAFRTKEA